MCLPWLQEPIVHPQVHVPDRHVGHRRQPVALRKRRRDGLAVGCPLGVEQQPQGVVDSALSLLARQAEDLNADFRGCVICLFGTQFSPASLSISPDFSGSRGPPRESHSSQHIAISVPSATPFLTHRHLGIFAKIPACLLLFPSDVPIVQQGFSPAPLHPLADHNLLIRDSTARARSPELAPSSSNPTRRPSAATRSAAPPSSRTRPPNNSHSSISSMSVPSGPSSATSRVIPTSAPSSSPSS